MTEHLSPLRVEGLTKRFGRTVAVHDVSIALAAGELLALVGPSGCGKSTLLRTIAGLHGADAGRIVVGDQVVDDGRRRLDPEHRRVGLVFQDHALFPHMTVRDNVGFGVRGVNRRARAAKVDELLELVDCAPLATRFPHEISGGERQRVALARAIAPAPRLLLFDEPFASLDPVLRVGIRAEIVALLHATKTAAVFVTHDQTEALAVGDRVAVLREGRLQQVGTPTEVYDRPANRFVAEFLGEANLLPVIERDGELVSELGPVVRPPELAGLATDGLVAVLRPQHIELVPDSAGSATVVATEFRGPNCAVTARLDSGALLRVTTTEDRTRFPAGLRVAPKMSAARPARVVRS